MHDPGVNMIAFAGEMLSAWGNLVVLRGGRHRARLTSPWKSLTRRRLPVWGRRSRRQRRMRDGGSSWQCGRPSLVLGFPLGTEVFKEPVEGFEA